MPILDVEIVTAAESAHAPGLPAGLAARLADVAGVVFGTPAGRTWVRLRRLDGADYAENGGGPEPGVLPVFVTVLQLDPPDAGDLATQVGALARAIADATDRPVEHVHVLYEPPARGRIAFGGGPVRS